MVLLLLLGGFFSSWRFCGQCLKRFVTFHEENGMEQTWERTKQTKQKECMLQTRVTEA